MKNILFIGGAGFIGSNLIKAIEHQGNRQYGLFVIEPVFSNISRLALEDVTIFRGEISNFDFVQSVIEANQIDTVVHLVATIIPGSTFEDYKREFQQVIFPTIELMQYCAQKDIRFVYFSSGGTVYGDRKGTVVPFKESDAMAPISYYGWSKQMMENSILYMHRTQNLQYIIIRPSNPYGKGQNLYGKQGLIAVALGKILAGENIQVWGDGSAVRDYIYIDDLGKAVVSLLSDPANVNITMNIGSGKGYNVNQIIGFLREIVKEEVGVDYVAARQTDVSSVVLDTTLLCCIIDFKPINIREGITKFYNDIRNGQQ